MSWLLALFACAQIHAQDHNNVELRLRALEERASALSLPPILATTDELRTHLGPAASKIYFSREKVALGLSADVLTYRETNTDRANVMSVAPTLAFRPHRRVIFNSQFLFENGGSESRNSVAPQKGQSVVLQAYVDWLSRDAGDAGWRAGHQLVPMGWSNTRQESVTYLSVLKPELERDLIPTNWHENGVSFWVDRPRADFQIGVFNSLDARGFRGETFVAGGRSQGQDAPANDLMGVMRLNAKNEWFLLGVSAAAGNTAQKDPALRNGGFRMGEGHLRLRHERFEFLGQAVIAQVDDADAISTYNGTVMGAEARGRSWQIAYDVLGGKRGLWLFARESHYDLHAKVPFGLTRDRRLEKWRTVIGASYFPLPHLVVKLDYVFAKNRLSDEADEFSFGLGMSF